jgi:hypothetical protein
MDPTTPLVLHHGRLASDDVDVTARLIHGAAEQAHEVHGSSRGAAGARRPAW